MIHWLQSQNKQEQVNKGNFKMDTIKKESRTVEGELRKINLPWVKVEWIAKGQNQWYWIVEVLKK